MVDQGLASDTAMPRGSAQAQESPPAVPRCWWLAAALGVACVAALAAIAVVDLATASRVDLGELALLPVLAAAWVLPVRASVAIVGVAVGGQIIAVAAGGVTPWTGATRCVVAVAVAVLARVAAAGLTGTRRAGQLASELGDEREARRRAETAQERALGAQPAVARNLSGEADLETFLWQLAATIASLIQARRVVFFRLDDRRTLTPLPGAHGLDNTSLGRVGSLSCERTGTGPVSDSVFADAVRRTPPDGASADPFCAALGARDGMTVGWRAGDERLGVLGAYDSLRPGGFTDEDAEVLRTAALAAGLRWSQRRTEVDDQRGSRDLRLMQDLASTLATATDVSLAMTAVLRGALQAASGRGASPRRATILRLDGDTAVVAAQYGDVAESGEQQCRFPLDRHPALAEVARTGVPFAGRLDVLQLPDETLDMVHARGLVAAVVVALRLGDETLGVLTVSTDDEAGFSPAQVERVTAIGNLAGLAIGNAERLELLQRQAERAAALERAKSDFLRLASHELRSPLGIVSGYLSMVRDGTFGERHAVDMTRPLPMLDAKIAEVSALVEQMLEMARLEDRRLELARERLDLRPLVSDVVERTRERRLPRHRIEAALGGDPLLVNADARRVTRILTNLVDNAIKYSPAGGEVRVAAQRRGEEIHLSVRDQGLGIAPEQLPSLFTRFGRLVTRDTRHISGIGLGLYLSRELARLHGGDITVESSPGEGSTFTLLLPAASGGPGEVRVPGTPAARTQSGSPAPAQTAHT